MRLTLCWYRNLAGLADVSSPSRLSHSLQPHRAISDQHMFKTKFAIVVAAGLILAPAQLLAQNTGGTPLPPRPGDRAAPSNGVGGTALPTQSGQRVAPSSGTGGGSAAPALPGGPTGTTTGNADNPQRR
ncbi:hypothetical protein QA635_37440 [Bradyrhizobium brasilense]|uniref:hypothetical protein n=1 Tax=Bradyrhizobium brasilense TaxID=1419277 RepID=UPI0024B1B04A|nr:hypothetical protein [Bradyrhizobium australafricanum]WFU32111.1 hypothetical protein QA635_37440 [Bradyrhizobium australafricanum]